MIKSVTPVPSGARPLIAYTTCTDPQLAVFDADLTADERVWLGAVLDRLATEGEDGFENEEDEQEAEAEPA